MCWFLILPGAPTIGIASGKDRGNAQRMARPRNAATARQQHKLTTTNHTTTTPSQYSQSPPTTNNNSGRRADYGDMTGPPTIGIASGKDRGNAQWMARPRSAATARQQHKPITANHTTTTPSHYPRSPPTTNRYGAPPTHIHPHKSTHITQYIPDTLNNNTQYTHTKWMRHNTQSIWMDIHTHKHKYTHTYTQYTQYTQHTQYT